MDLWIDNHCHLDGENDPAATADEARANGVDAMVCVGVTVERSKRCVELASAIEDVWATAGVHPHDATEGIAGLAEVITSGRETGTLVAVGECGLDYHYDHSPRSVQQEVFASQIELALQFRLPLVIHTREAWEDTFGILDSVGVPERTVFHCFTGGPTEASAALERGAMLSLSGILTFGGADDLRDAARAAPLSSLMVETDSPYLAPVPHRGEKNRPWYVKVVGECLAELQGVAPELVATTTSNNARRFYGLPAAKA